MSSIFRTPLGLCLLLSACSSASLLPDERTLVDQIADPDPAVRKRAAYGLGQLPPTESTINALIRSLADPYAEVREGAAYSLSRSGPTASTAVPALAKLLDDPNENVRECAARSLGSLGPLAVDALPELVRAVRGGDDDPFQWPLWALGRIGAPAVPDLVKLLEGGDERIRINAVEALKEIGPAAAFAGPALLRRFRKGDYDVGGALARLGPAGLSYLLEAFRDDNLELRDNAVSWMAGMGDDAKEAAPVLVAGLTTESISLRDRIQFALNDLGATAIPALIQGLKDAHPEVRSGSAMVLFLMEKKAAPAAAALLAALGDDDDDVRSRASSALGQLGSPVIPALRETLKDANPRVRSAAAMALGEMREDGAVAALEISELLQQGDKDYIEDIVQALHDIGPDAWPAAPNLVRLLKHPDPEFRSLAMFALEALDSRAKDAVPAVVAALKDVDPDVRRWVPGVLAAIAPTDPTLVPLLVDALRNGDESLQESAAEALGHFGTAARDAVPDLLRVLREEGTETRRNAALSLGALDPESKEIDATLQGALMDPEPEVVFAAAKALLRRKSKLPEAIAQLVRLRREGEAFFSAGVGDTLKTIGPEARELIPTFIELLGDPDYNLDLNGTARNILIRIGAPAVPALREALLHPNVRIRLNAVGALAGIGPDVDGVLPAIAVATIDLDSNVVVAATSALGEFGAAGLPALQEALRDPATVTRSHAAWSLLRMGPAAQPAVPQLIKLLSDPEGQTCQAAVAALAAIGPGARDAVPALMGLLSDGDLRHDVQKALDEILKGYKER